VSSQEDAHVILCIDKSEVATDRKLEYSARIVKIANCLIAIEKIIAVVLFPLSMVLFVCLIVCYIKQRTWENFEPVIILLGIFLSMFLLELGVTVFNSWLNKIWFYSIGVVPLAQAFEILSLVYAYSTLAKRKGAKDGRSPIDYMQECFQKRQKHDI
jgi:hypothetical protein